jgi:hypothetical protein
VEIDILSLAELRKWKRRKYEIFKDTCTSDLKHTILKPYPHNTLKIIPSLHPNEDIYEEQIV